MANKHRGEIDLPLGGKTYVCRPTFEAMAEYEGACGLSTYRMLADAAEGKHPLIGHMAAVFHSTIIAAWKPADGRPPTKAAIGNMLQRDGAHHLFTKYVEILSRAVASDADIERMQAQAGDEGKASEGAAEVR